MLLIPDVQYRRAAYIIDTGGFADLLLATMKSHPRDAPEAAAS